MFQFTPFPSLSYEFTQGYIRIAVCGFPHSDICGSMDMCSSPQLFAAYHVLLRLPVPRHPPDALVNLTINTCIRVIYRIFSSLLLVSEFLVSLNKMTDESLLPISVLISIRCLFVLHLVLFNFQGTFFAQRCAVYENGGE